jgi:hypothetical protein
MDLVNFPPTENNPEMEISGSLSASLVRTREFVPIVEYHDLLLVDLP